MPEPWATSTMKSVIRAWLTARDRAITAGHELIEMVEDLVEEVRHERALEAQRPAAPAPVVARPPKPRRPRASSTTPAASASAPSDTSRPRRTKAAAATPRSTGTSSGSKPKTARRAASRTPGKQTGAGAAKSTAAVPTPAPTPPTSISDRVTGGTVQDTPSSETP